MTEDNSSKTPGVDEADPQRWIARISRCEKVNEEKKRETMRFKKAYTGDFQNKNGEEVSKYTVRINFIYYFVETILASVFGGDPKVLGKAKKDPRAQMAADLLAYNTNYWAVELDTKKEMHDCVFDSFFGPAAMYTGWEYVTTPDGQVIKDQPLVRWLNFWEEVRVDPDVMRTRRARWMAVRITVPHSEFIEMQNIREDVRIGENALEPTQRPEDMLNDDNSYRRDKNNVPSDAEWISYWEIWDRERMEKKYVHADCPDYFLNAVDPATGVPDLSWPYEMEVKDDPFPITILHAKQDPFGPMSFSELKAIEDQIWERVRLRSVQGAIARRSAPKYVYKKGAGTKEQIKKLLTSDILSANELNQPENFNLIAAPEIPQGFYQWDTQLAEDLGNTSGLAEFQNNQIANTATEASIAEGRSTVRKTERSNKIEEFVVTVLSKVAQLTQQLQLREQTFMIDPEDILDGEPDVFNVTREQIQGEFNLELIPGSMEFINSEVEKRDLLRFLEIAGPLGIANDTVIIQRIGMLMNLDPRKVMLDEEQRAERANAGAESTLKFAPLKLEELSPADKVRVVEAAKTENGIQSLTPEPREAAQQQLQQLERTSIPVNDSKNMAGGQVPQAPVAPASMTSER